MKPEDLYLLNSDLLQSVTIMDFAGYDPFDALNSAFIKKTLPGKSRFLRLAWVQLGKRSPWNVRPLLRIPKSRNPKGIGLFILGMLEDHQRTGEQRYLDKAVELADWLLCQQCDKARWEFPCWGYHFDWQARAFYVPQGTPNIITTCYVSLALHGLGKRLDRKDYADVALDSARFIAKHLFSQIQGRTFFAYIPGETTLVHNANLWGAAWVALAGVQSGDHELQNMAIEAARQSVSEQQRDGSWVYGVRHHHQFIDGFHTGYNLEALNLLCSSLDISEFDDSIERGIAYYRKNLFLNDGTAKYYNNNIYPLDMHSFTQGVLTLLKVSGTDSDIALAEKIISRAIDMLYVPREKRFIYQKNRWYRNRVNYIRWTQAWAYYCLAFFNRFMAGEKNGTC